MSELAFNPGAIDQAAEQAFKETCFLFGRECTKAISSPDWPWSDGGTRDIVDTGQLRSSQQLVFKGPFEAVISWNVNYAAPVHEGATFKNGTTIPARPWTVRARQNFNFPAVYGTIFQSKLK